MITFDAIEMRRRFQPGQPARPAAGEISGRPEDSASLAQRILAAHARAIGEAPQRLELGPPQARPAAVTADDVLRAYRRANGEEDDDGEGDKKKKRDDDQPADDRPPQRHRGPSQERGQMTAAGIIRAMKIARNER